MNGNDAGEFTTHAGNGEVLDDLALEDAAEWGRHGDRACVRGVKDEDVQSFARL